LDERAGLGTLVKDLGLAFVDLAAAGHEWRRLQRCGSEARL
jgi:hypothetical protein